MAQRRFTNIRVSSEVRVMSDGHFWFRVFMTGGVPRDYAIDLGFMEADNAPSSVMGWKAPKYLVEEVDKQIGVMFRDKTAKFYECDRDGWKRYDNLRYLDMDMVAWWAAKLAPADGE